MENYVQLPFDGNYAIRMVYPYDVINIQTGRPLNVTFTGGIPSVRIGNQRLKLHEIIASIIFDNYSPGTQIGW